MSLSGTGGVRVTLDLCSALISSGYKVSLIVNDVGRVPFHYQMRFNYTKWIQILKIDASKISRPELARSTGWL